MNIIIRILLFTVLSVLGCAGAMAQTCSDLMQSHAVPEPTAVITGSPLVGGILDCSYSQTAMFEKNHNAIRAAQPIAEATEIFGTWLGDNVLLYVLGVIVPGQEVLRITPGPDAGSIRIQQYWIKASWPGGQSFPWHAEEGYQGVVADAILLPEQLPGKFRADIYGDGTQYSELSFEYDRSHDLWVKSKLNYFEDSIEFALDGNALVLRFARREPITREFSPDLATFTRVSDGAPDLAILLITALELSQARNFDCFTHQLSSGKGALIDAMAPSSSEDIRKLLGEMAVLQADLNGLMAETRRDAATSDAQREAMMVLFERTDKLRSTPAFENTISSLAEAKDLGCPELY